MAPPAMRRTARMIARINSIDLSSPWGSQRVFPRARRANPSGRVSDLGGFRRRRRAPRRGARRRAARGSPRRRADRRAGSRAGARPRVRTVSSAEQAAQLRRAPCAGRSSPKRFDGPWVSVTPSVNSTTVSPEERSSVVSGHAAVGERAEQRAGLAGVLDLADFLDSERERIARRWPRSAARRARTHVEPGAGDAAQLGLARKSACSEAPYVKNPARDAAGDAS